MVGKGRAAKYRKRAPGLADLIERCWLVSPDVTECISRPLASALDRHLPEAARNAVDMGLEPVSVLIGTWRILSHCQEQEQRCFEHYRRSVEQAQLRVVSGGLDQSEVPMSDPSAMAEEGQSFDAIGADLATAPRD